MRWSGWLTVIGVTAIAAWAYAPTVLGLTRVWTTEPNYSHGYLVPLLALGLLVTRVWSDRPAAAPSLLWGAGLLTLAVVLRGAGAYFFITPFDHASLLVALVGLCLLFGGVPWLKRLWPALALLVFMFPLPASLGGDSLSSALQNFATLASTFALETLGVAVAREGNVIILKSAELGIVEACSGLKMLMVFCALAALTAFLVPCGWPRKVILFISAPLLAIACNVVRITAAGLASESLGTETGLFVFHDLAGWLMIPLAFVLLGCEVYLLSKLFSPVDDVHPEAPPVIPRRESAPKAEPAVV
jgi:exosortase